MNYVTTRTALAVVAAQPAPVKRVPPVVDDDLLPDMGRMTQGWLLEERIPCSPAATLVRHSAHLAMSLQSKGILEWILRNRAP